MTTSNSEGSLAIVVDQVTRRYGALTALDDVSFAVPKRSIFGLVGANGAGKTTLFSIIAGFLRPTEGRVQVLGHDSRDVRPLLGRLSTLPQDAQFQRNVPLFEQLVFFRLLQGASRAQAREDVHEVLNAVGLAQYGDRGVQVLSHGMNKRLGVAQAFLGRPEVILLDEPTAGLDPKNAKGVRDLIVELTAGEATVVISSHNLRELEEICDHVAIMHKGVLRDYAAMRDITRAGSFVSLELSRDLSAEETSRVAEMPGVAKLEVDRRGRITLEFEDTDSDPTLAKVLRELLDCGAIPHSLKRGNRLEDYFLDLTEGEGASDDAPAASAPSAAAPSSSESPGTNGSPGATESSN